LKFHVKYGNNVLKPLEKHKLKEGEIYHIEVKLARNYQFHKKFFSLVGFAHLHTHLEMPLDAYRKYLICKAGYCDVYHTSKGAYVEPHSIAFDKMDEETFEDLYNRVLDAVAEDIDVSREDILNELLNFC